MDQAPVVSRRSDRVLGMPDSLSIRQARRLALAAQGLTGSRATRPASAASLGAALGRVGAVQIDSVNVVARSHELTLAARAGAHDPAAFDRLVYRRRAGFEQWGHAASFLPVESFRWFLPRMHAARAEVGKWFLVARTRHPEWYPRVLERIRAEGPLAASAFREPADGRRGAWWDWTPAKAVLEDLFAQGVLLVHDRVRFERRYDLAERVLPGALDLADPSPEEAAVALTVLAARALGVATAADLADYFRLSAAETRAALAEATASGLLRRPRRARPWRRRPPPACCGGSPSRAGPSPPTCPPTPACPPASSTRRCCSARSTR